MSDSLLSVRDLKKHYSITEGPLDREVGRVRAVDGVSFELRRGETLGVVGESGCGKSTVATTLMGLEEPTAGEVRFDGDPVDGSDAATMREFRQRAGMVFQDPTSSFDPRMTVGESVAEPLRIHGLTDESRRREIVTDLLERVGLSAADADRYPHAFSGGQKQRAALARALVLNPDLLVADEPVSALDVSVQAAILSLLDDLQREFDLAVLLISHDISVVREVTDRVAVMYLGEVVETGPTEEVLSNPQHPYTRALVASVPDPDPSARDRSASLSGEVPDPSDPPSGCRFHTRCPEVIPPERYDLTQEGWRAVLDLRLALADGVDREALREATSGSGAAEASLGDASAASGNGDGANEAVDLRAAARDRFDLPPELGDPDAESVVAEALDLLTSGDSRAAHDLLADAFETPCERDRPDLCETDAGHPAACHLHEGAVESPPEAGPGR